MIIFRGILNLLILLAAVACNTTEQTSVELTASENSLRTETFVYNHPQVEFVQNTTTASILPRTRFDGYFFKVLPTLPDGLKINTTTGEIFGEATGVSIETEYLIEATKKNDKQYAFVKITVLEEAPRTIHYQYSNLNFTYNDTNQYLAILTGGIVTNYTASPALPIGFSIDSSGILSGTPTSLTGGIYTITASNSTGSASVSVLINIQDIAPRFDSPCANSNQLIDVGNPIIAINCALAAPLPFSDNYSINPKLPAGLSLDTATGVISGIPTETNGVTSYILTAYNTSGSDDYNVNIAVSDPAFSLTYGVTTIETQKDVAISPVPVAVYTGGTPVAFTCTANCGLGINVDINTGLISGTTTAAGISALMIITATGPKDAGGVASVVNTNITLNLVEDYPEDNTNLGYLGAYIFYKDYAISNSTPGISGGMATEYTSNPLINTIDPGLGLNPITGEIIGTPSTAFPAVSIEIVGNNINHLGTRTTLITKQTISITSKLLAPTMLGYIPTASPFYNSQNQTFELQDGSNIALGIQPNITSGGYPTFYTISPQLPNGLALNSLTGYITGVPNEIKPVTYHTITGTNDSGSFSETIAISTNTLIAPVSLNYNDADCTVAPIGNNTLVFNIFVDQTETPCYVGSQGLFTITPDLPAGLSMHPNTGVISGTPIVTSETTDTYTVGVTNVMGTLSPARTITILVNNIAVSNLAYLNAAASSTMTMTVGDSVDATNIIHSSDYDKLDGSGGYITNYLEITGVLGTFNLSLDASSGDITDTGTGIIMDQAREYDPQATIINMRGEALTPAYSFVNASFTLEVNDKPLVFSFGNLSNSFMIQSGTKTTNGVATHTGGEVATTDVTGTLAALQGGGPLYCEAQYVSDTAALGAGATDINGAGVVGISLDQNDCSINYTFDGSTCALNSKIEYNIVAYNSGSPTGKTVTINMSNYDAPNFTFAPIAHNLATTPLVYTDDTIDTSSLFYNSTALTLDATDPTDLTTGAYGPFRRNMCHVGTFTLNDAAQLPNEVVFNAIDGSFSTVNQVLVGRRSFNLSATEIASGSNLSMNKDISVQANHVLDNSASAVAGIGNTFKSTTFDFNMDGQDDIILQNTVCKPGAGACAVDTIKLFLADGTDTGVYANLENAALPIASQPGITSVTPIQYDVTKSAIIYINNDGADIATYSTGASPAEYFNNGTPGLSTTTLSDTGYGIVSFNKGITTGLGAFTISAAGLLIVDHFTIYGASVASIDNAGTPTLGMDASATPATTVNGYPTGGVTVNTANNIIIKSSDMNNDGAMEAFIGYTEATVGSESINICILDNDTSAFKNICAARVPITTIATTELKEIIMEDVTGDSLDDLIVLVQDATLGTNIVYIFENRNNNFPGQFQLSDTLSLKSGSMFVDISVGDLNGDGRADIISNDVVGNIGMLFADAGGLIDNSGTIIDANIDSVDTDGDGDAAIDSDGDGTATNDKLLTGYSIYYHTGTSDIYNQVISTPTNTGLYYAGATGTSTHLNLINSQGIKQLFHCNVDVGSNAATVTVNDGANSINLNLPVTTNSTCGIVGGF